MLTSLQDDYHKIHTSYNQQPLTAQHFSPEEIHLYKRRMEEGYDIPDPCYRLWLVSVTAESVFVAASTIHSAANLFSISS